MSTLALALLVTLSTTVMFFALLQLLRRGAARQRENVERAASQSLVDLFIFIDTRQLLLANLALLIALPLLVWLVTQNLIFVLAAAVAAIYFPRALVAHLRKRRLLQVTAQMPDALLMLASGLRAGLSMASALEVLAQEQPPPFSQEIALLLRTQRMGVTFDEALGTIEARLPLEEFRLFAAAMRISRAVGGNLAETLETLAQTLARKAEVEGKIRSLTAQGRMQAVVMTALPLTLMLVLRVLEPEPMAYLFHSLVGWAVLVVIVLMEIAGFFFIRRIVNIDI